MRHRRKVVSTVLSASILVAGFFAVVRLVQLFDPDYSGWPPLRQRPASQAPAPTPSAQMPVPAPKPGIPPWPPASTAPAPCTAAQIPTPPPGAQAPGSSSMDYGGEPIGLGRGYLEGFGPTYSPDGREVAFTKDTPKGYRIWITRVDGRNLRQLTPNMHPDPVFKDGVWTGMTSEGGPAWSPDGSRIAFVSGASGNSDIWVVRRDGSNPMRLTTDLVVVSSPAWSPGGSQLVFTANRPASRSRGIWIMNTDGTNQRRLTNLTGYEHYPAFAPDGRRLVFMSAQDDPARRGNQTFNLMIINVDGTGLCQLTTGNFHDYQPSWSTSGIVFQRSSLVERICCALWLIQPDGSGLQGLPRTTGSNPVWSPDGTRITFDDGGHIYVFNLRDRTIKPLTQFNVVSIVIYIKPGFANTINPKTDDRIPVAILSAPWFDPVRQIDQASITFGPTGHERAPVSCVADEVNQDGVPDLVCHFDVAAKFSPAHMEGILKANDVSGVFYEGRDAVKVLGPP